MAINTWLTVTLGGATSKQPDRADHRHSCAPATADGGNLTVAWDSAVITSLTLFDSAVDAARKIAAGRLPP